MDIIDRKILNLLQKDAKISHKEISGKLNMSRTPVFERIKKLERRGIIKKYITLLNSKKIEKGLTVFCFITLKEHGVENVNKFQRSIQKLSKVMEAYHTAGNFDFFLKVIVQDVDEYQKFVVSELSGVGNIRNVQSSFVLGVLKYQLNFEFNETD